MPAGGPAACLLVTPQLLLALTCNAVCAPHIQAFEANNQNGISALRSDCKGVVKGLTFELRPWSGGWTSNPKIAPLATGKFAQLSSILTVAGVLGPRRPRELGRVVVPQWTTHSTAACTCSQVQRSRETCVADARVVWSGVTTPDDAWPCSNRRPGLHAQPHELGGLSAAHRAPGRQHGHDQQRRRIHNHCGQVRRLARLVVHSLMQLSFLSYLWDLASY